MTRGAMKSAKEDRLKVFVEQWWSGTSIKQSQMNIKLRKLQMVWLGICKKQIQWYIGTFENAMPDDEETQERYILSKDFSHKKDEVTKQVLTSNVESHSFVISSSCWLWKKKWA